jgi:hypothetical protein
MAKLRAWRGDNEPTSNQPRLNYQVFTGHHIWVPPGGTPDHGTVVPVGSLLIFDHGTFREGELSYRPKYDDSRMVLRGVETPVYSGDPGYIGGIKLNVLVAHFGPCTLTVTSETACRALDRLWDGFIFAVEAQAGKLPVYRIAEPRSFNVEFRPDPLFGPMYIQTKWVDRPEIFGPRLIPPPKSQPALVYEVATAPALESDKPFDVSQGEVLLPEISTSKQKAAKRTSKRDQKWPEHRSDLDDEIPF